MVSIPGGEPLMHPEIDKIVEGLVARKKYIYLCTNALLLKEKLSLFKPSKYLTFSVHLDGQREHHDFSVCREGGYEIAVDAVREAIQAGFRVTTNSTLFDGVDPQSVRAFFDEMMDLGRRGNDGRARLFLRQSARPAAFPRPRPHAPHVQSDSFESQDAAGMFNQSPLYLEFLMGKRHYNCTPWGMPTYNLFGWQKPCYLLQDGYADTFAELMETTAWEQYGTESGNPKCANCMVHCGFEPSAVHDGFSSLRGFAAMARSYLFTAYPDQDAERLLQEPVQPVHAHNPFVNIQLETPRANPSRHERDQNPEIWR